MNQQIYKNIVETEGQLIYHKFFTLSEINQLSFFDFKFYTELLSTIAQEANAENNDINPAAFENDPAIQHNMF